MSASIKPTLIGAIVLMLLVGSIEPMIHPGSVMEEMQPDDYIRGLVTVCEPELNQMYGGRLVSVEPLAYRDQIVSGTMHFIRVKITGVDGSTGIIHLNIWDRPSEKAKLHAVRIRVDERTPLTRFVQNDF